MTCIHLYMLVLRVIDSFPASPTIDHPPLQCFSVSGVITRATPHLQNPCSNFPDTFWARLPGSGSPFDLFKRIWGMIAKSTADIHCPPACYTCTHAAYTFPNVITYIDEPAKQKRTPPLHFINTFNLPRLETCVF